VSLEELDGDSYSSHLLGGGDGHPISDLDEKSRDILDSDIASSGAESPAGSTATKKRKERGLPTSYYILPRSTVHGATLMP